MTLHRKRNKTLGLPELVAIALGGMVGGGIFTILGVSVSLIGNLTSIAIIVGGIIAGAAAYSYIKLGVYHKDEGATYAFFKRTYSDSPFSAATIGSITFILVSLFMAVANLKIRKETNSNSILTITAIISLGIAGLLILYYKLVHSPLQMVVIVALYIILGIGARFYSNKKANT